MDEMQTQNQNPSQCKLVLDYIRDFGSITTFDAFIDLGITRLSGRIYNLRKMGYNITDRTEAVKNRRGSTCYVKRYFLDEQGGAQ